MNGLRRWDIVIVPFPFVDADVEKMRPAVIVSRDDLLQRHDMAWLAMITSTLIAPWNSDITVEAVASTGLLRPSRIRIAKISTIDRQRIVRRVGSLAATDAKKVTAALKRWL